MSPLSFPLQYEGRIYDWQSADGVFARNRFDFGSRFLLETADLPESGPVLDLGCGTGALGILSGLNAPGRWCCMVDVNRHALLCARKNLNALEPPGGGGLAQASFLSAFRDRSFQAVLFNPPIRVGKAILLEVLSELPRVLRSGGSLHAVVRSQQGAKSYLAHLDRVFEGRAEIVGRRKGYLILRAWAADVDGDSVGPVLSSPK